MGRRSQEKLARVGVTASPAETAEAADSNHAAAIDPPEAGHEQAPLLPPAVEQWLRGHGVELGICLFLALAALAVFGRTIGHEFVLFDDNEYVYQNRHVRDGLTLAGIGWAFTHVHLANWHPLTTLSHELDCSLYGLWPGGHHLTSLLLHAAASVVLFLALRRLTGAVWPSGIVAASSVCTRCTSSRWPGSRSGRTCSAASSSVSRYGPMRATPSGRFPGPGIWQSWCSSPWDYCASRCW